MWRATCALVVALLISLASRSSQAATCTWNPPSGNSFNTVANWSCGHVPVAADDVVFNGTKTTSCTLDTSPAVLSFSINSGYTGTFTQSAGQTLTTSGAFTQGAGTFAGGNSTIQIGASFNLTAGTFTSTSGLLLVGGAFNKTGGVFTHNSGRVVLSSITNQAFASNGATFYSLVINDGLIGYWKLDETAGPSADSSGYGQSATWNGTASGSTTVPPTNFTNSHSLNAVAATDEAHFTTAQDASKITVTAWIYETTEVSGVTAPRVVDMPGYLLLVHPSTDMVSGENVRALQWTSNRSTTPGTWQTGANTIALNTWYHVAVTYDSTSTSNAPMIYINGVSSPASLQVAPVGTQVSQAGTAYIGNKANHTRVFGGDIDEVQLYNRILSPTDISGLAAGNQAGASVATQTMSGALTIAQDLVIASGTLAAGSNAITVGGNWWNYGGQLTTTGLVTLNGSAAGNTIRSGGQAFGGGLTVSGAGSWTAGDRLWVTGAALTVSAGTLDASSWTAHAGSIANSAGTLTTSNATVVMDGASNSTLPALSPSALHIEDPTETGLVGYWKADEGQGFNIRDSSGSGNTGTLLGGATWVTSGLPAITFDDPAGLSFDGVSGYVDVAAAVVPTNAAFSACTWVIFTALTGFDTLMSIDGTNISGFYLQRESGGKFKFLMYASDSSGAAQSPAWGTSTPTTGIWYHLCGVFDGSIPKLYVNGALEATGSAVSGTWAAPGHTILGAGKFGGSRVDYVNGKLDDTRLYNVALTAAQVQALAAGGYANTGGTSTVMLGGSATVGGLFAMDSGSLNMSSLNLTTGNTDATQVAIVNQQTLTVGSGTASLKGGLTIGGSGTLSSASTGTISIGSGKTLTVNGTLNASNTGTTIKSVSGSYAFQVGSTATATPTLNISGLAVKNTDANGMQINVNTGAVTTFSQFDNIAFSSGTAGGELLQIYAKGLYLASTGCTFDAGVSATTTYSVKLTGNGATGSPDTTETRAMFGASTCATSFTSCQVSKSDDDSDSNGVGNTLASNGAVVQFVRAASTDTAGTVVGFPTSAFDWSTFTYYSTYVGLNAASGTSPVVYVRDGAGVAQYSWTAPAGETIVGTPRWTTVSSVHYLYVALASGKIYRLIDSTSGHTLTPDTTGNWASTNNPFDCTCAVVTPLVMDSNNLYWGGTTSGPIQKIWTLGQTSRAQPTGSPFTITPVITSAAPALWTGGVTSYLVIGLTGNIVKLDVTNQVLSATNTLPGSASVLGRVGTNGTTRIFAGDDGGNLWAIDPTNFVGTNKVWSYPVSSDAIKSSPYYDATSNTVQFGTEAGKVVVLNSTGTALTGYPYTPGTATDSIRSALLFVGGVLAVGTTTGKLFFIDRQTGSGPALIRQYSFGPTESVSGIAYDTNTHRYMVSTADPAVKDGRLYYFDLIADPTPGSS